MSKAQVFAAFAPGQRVRLSRVASEQFRGRVGTIRKCVKRSREIEVVVDVPPTAFDGHPGSPIYRAFPENIDAVTDPLHDACADCARLIHEPR